MVPLLGENTEVQGTDIMSVVPLLKSFDLPIFQRQEDTWLSRRPLHTLSPHHPLKFRLRHQGLSSHAR